MLLFVETARIAELLAPFLGSQSLTEHQLISISTYIDLLLKWNARMNLTAVRSPEQIVERHFGEALFAARHLLTPESAISVADVGSGAGFPGIPLKIYAPNLKLTLIEAQGKKATFLREVARTLYLAELNVFANRADEWGKSAELVTLRAVEKFEDMLPVASTLVSSGGRLALLVGERQSGRAEEILPGNWLPTVSIPESRERVLKVLQKD
jgi:16S rRNA (guanine527-N7)-methyltransferase